MLLHNREESENSKREMFTREATKKAEFLLVCFGSVVVILFGTSPPPTTTTASFNLPRSLSLCSHSHVSQTFALFPSTHNSSKSNSTCVCHFHSQILFFVLFSFQITKFEKTFESSFAKAP
jgi:hypothetical protein